jgi:hypothetical protein
MKSAFSLVGAILLLSLAPATANAKGSGIGIYALIDRVTFDQEGPTPNSIRIYGVFVVPQRMASGAYQPPQRGFLYFQIPPGAEEAARKDWAQLKTVAGTGQVVGFTFYWVPNPNDPQGNPHHSLEVRVRADGDTAAPEVYPLVNPQGVLKAADQIDPYFNEVDAQLRQR